MSEIEERAIMSEWKPKDLPAEHQFRSTQVFDPERDLEGYGPIATQEAL